METSMLCRLILLQAMAAGRNSVSLTEKHDSQFSLLLARLLAAQAGSGPAGMAQAAPPVAAVPWLPQYQKPAMAAAQAAAEAFKAARGSKPYEAVVEKAALRHGVDPALCKAVARVESGFNPGATSEAGAMGLMQLMPGTARSLGVTNPYDPAQNADAGVRYLKSMLDKYKGDVKLALAAYNAGPAAVDRHRGVPPYGETLQYIDKVTGFWRLYAGG
ncbi:lytic transglycosylase domain-containing protein [Desulforamulus hydrothermalis]|uniref:Lytic transglycosylase catalytic n=1 Tax=Desulforamulus hydrothermalis Lam5 = DSM 18033 TaxID=1121428 RepID=K8DYJ8_9FIRM|nr:lytic transglycosylase domain-containing protein [Desulforamulus hydrothermalis]CCO07899.1 Lytic transglycosylase catalytic [Desulforamulus hydrothermalis Lam5 = DSM 18033]SHH35027.1 Transglycosylase SLT domain-containing protein [Desulforamulus hydrothermalis Lam5 = DSM 18033]